jgi:hypothetical protein
MQATFIHHITLADAAAVPMAFVVNAGSDVALFKAYPPGHGVRTPAHLALTGDYRDTRPTRGDDVERHFEFALLLVRAVARPMEVVMHSSRALYASCATANALYPCVDAVPVSRVASVWWTTERFQFNGTLVSAYTHAHRVAESGVFAWDADAAALGLGASVFGSAQGTEAVDLLERALRRARPKCGTPRGTEGRLTGSDGFACSPWTFRVGDARTVLCGATVPPTLADEWIGQHCALYLTADVSPPSQKP